MTETKKNNRLQNIIKDLTSDDNKKIITALKQLRKHGKAEAINYTILDALVSSDDELIQQEVMNFLFDLKDESTITPLLSAIEDQKYQQYKNRLISIFWESSLNASEHIGFFINQAIKGDYMTCLEVLTVIENFEDSFQEDEIENLKYDLNEAIETEETEKGPLLISLKTALSSLNIVY